LSIDKTLSQHRCTAVQSKKTLSTLFVKTELNAEKYFIANDLPTYKARKPYLHSISLN
jgi:hypothetical protein